MECRYIPLPNCIINRYNILISDTSQVVASHQYSTFRAYRAESWYTGGKTSRSTWQPKEEQNFRVSQENARPEIAVQVSDAVGVAPKSGARTKSTNRFAQAVGVDN